MKIAKTAPKALVQWYEDMPSDDPPIEKEWLGVLISESSEPVMAKVWRSLVAREPFKVEINRPGGYTVTVLDDAGSRLWAAVHDALSVPPPEFRDTRDAHTKKMMDISKAANELARMLDHALPMRYVGALDLLSDTAMEYMVRRLGVYGEMEKLAKRLKARVGSDRVPDYMRYSLTYFPVEYPPTLPSAQEMLRSLAEMAMRRAQEPPIVKKVNIENYEAIHFVRVMTKWMMRYYGQPMRRVVADVGSLYFGEMMTEDFVRQNAPTSN